MRCRIPADPRRKQIRKRAQSALFRRAMLRTVRVQVVRNAAHKPPLFRRAIRSQSRVQSAHCRRAVCAQCRARSEALPPCNLCAVSRTIRCSSVAQSVRNAAHGPPLFCRAIRSQCRAQPAAHPPCNLCAVSRTIRCSSVAQSVRTAAHGPPLFCRAIRSQCRAQSAAQCSPSSRTIGCRCNLPPTPCCRNRH